MRSAWLFAFLLGCQPTATTRPVGQGASTSAAQVVPRLPPPPVLDLDAPDAPYRAAVAVQVQPGWAQFLEDCRLRLPATHPLNVMTLATTADITVDATGKVIEVSLDGSGNDDFDRAVKQVIADSAPLPKPPASLWSDDDRAHLRWLFARDRRQAGPATAQVVEYLQPIREVTTRLIAAGDLTRAARRIKREPAAIVERDRAGTELMMAGLREALASSDAAVRRAAVDAIGEANIGALADDVDALLGSTSDVELRLAAIATSGMIGNRSAVHVLYQQLTTDIRTDRKLALAEVDALVALDGEASVATLLEAEVTRHAGPNPIALHALGRLAVSTVASQLAGFQRTGDARVRAGICSAAIRAPLAIASSLLAKGLRDRDATVRTRCLEAITARMERAALSAERGPDVGPGTVGRIGELVKDRDVLVRAAAIRALGAAKTEATALPDLSGDTAAAVRVAYLRTIDDLSKLRPLDRGRERVRPLLEDRDADVRAAAWDAYVTLLQRPVDRIEGDPPPEDFDRLVSRAAQDAAPVVRRAVVAAITDDVALVRMAGGDDDGEVRTRALVRTVRRSGRAQSADLLLGRFATATPGSAERVRAALAWHLAR